MRAPLGLLRHFVATLLLPLVSSLVLSAGCASHTLTLRTTPEDVRVLRGDTVLCEQTPCRVPDERSVFDEEVRLVLEREGERRSLVVTANRIDLESSAARAASTACGGVVFGGLCVAVGVGAGPLGLVAGPLGLPVPALCGVVGGGFVVCSSLATAIATPLTSRVGPDEVSVDWERGAVTSSPPARIQLSRDPG